MTDLLTKKNGLWSLHSSTSHCLWGGGEQSVPMWLDQPTVYNQSLFSLSVKHKQVSPIRVTLNSVITSPFTCCYILSAETEEMKSDHERMGVARGVKGEKARQCCAEAVCLLWGGVELTEATSRDSSLSIKALRRRGRVCQGFPIPSEHPHAAPPTLNTFSQSRKSSSCCHKASRLIGNAWPIPSSGSQTSAEFST